MAEVTDPSIYRFGLFEVDARSGELRKQGLRLRLRGRPIDILLLLLERPGEVVTRQELKQRLWAADTFVDFDHGLHSAVNRLREALGDSAENPRFVETLPRRGYRFIAPVTAVQHTASRALTTARAADAETATPHAAERPVHAVATASPRESVPHAIARRGHTFSRYAISVAVAIGLLVMTWLMIVNRASRATPVPGAGRMTIAVLPFANLSGDAEQDYLSDGFTEELIAELGTIVPDRLTVIGRTTSNLYKGARKSIGQIGRELGVMYLLEGSVRRAGSRVRVTAQLVDTRSMTHLWSESYERDVGDVLSVQTDVAQRIATSLALALAPSSPASPAASPSSFAAYELFMRGRFFREQATEEGARRAIDYYERAILLDPNYAAAHAAMADAYRLLGAPGWEVDRPSVLLARAKTAAERALSLDPRSPQARAVLAMIRFNFEWDPAGAEREILEALKLNPSYAQAHQYYSGILTTAGRHDAAIAAARRAVELDPLAPTATTTLGVRYYYARRLEDAIQQFQKTLELSPDFPVAHWGLAQCYRLQRRFDDQIRELQRAVQLSGNSAYMRSHLAYGYAVAGDRPKAEALGREILSEAGNGYLAPYHLALIAVGLGDKTETLRWLERAYADRSGWMMFLSVEPEFDSLRQEPEFQRVIAAVTPQK